MKFLYLLLTFFTIIPTFGLMAQSTVLATGGNTQTSAGSVSFSVGQLLVQTLQNSSGSVSFGVQQAFEFQTLSLEDFSGIALKLKSYPNPTHDFVFLFLPAQEQTGNETYELYDLSGRKLRSGTLTGEETSVSFQNLPASIYLLNVNREGNTIKTFKIIKK